jgi:hypothetical protein
MKRSLGIAVVGLTLLAAGQARATEVGSSRVFGLGFQFPAPTAIIGKLFIGGGNAIDFGLGFGTPDYYHCRNVPDYTCGSVGHYVSIHADYLWQDNIVRHRGLKLDWHIGAGARLAVQNAFHSGYAELIARMPLGLDFTFVRPSFLEAFIELAPGIMIVPPLYFALDAVIGVRFYF